MNAGLRWVVAVSVVVAFGCSSTPKPVAKTAPTAGAVARPVEETKVSNADAPIPGKPQPGEEVVELDYNNDQKPDVYKFYAQGTAPRHGAAAPADGSGGDQPDRPLRTESDLNGDNRIDVWQWYGRDGVKEKDAYDLDFDGRIDVYGYYEKGIVVRKEVFHAFGERADTFKYFEKGKLVRIERDRNGDGTIDTWEYWENDQIDRIGEDVDGDQSVDKWIKPKPKS